MVGEVGEPCADGVTTHQALQLGTVAFGTRIDDRRSRLPSAQDFKSPRFAEGYRQAGPRPSIEAAPGVLALINVDTAVEEWLVSRGP